MGIDINMQFDILRIVSGILHLGNVTFVEDGAEASQPADPSCMFIPQETEKNIVRERGRERERGRGRER